MGDAIIVNKWVYIPLDVRRSMTKEQFYNEVYRILTEEFYDDKKRGK